MKIAIISASVRKGRNSHRVALYLQNYVKDYTGAETEMLDLHQFNFPIFEERLRLLENPPDDVKAFAAAIKNCDGVIMVTPEYNGGYPASLKNAVDLLYDEWRRKPVAIATVSDGAFGGTQVITSLQFSLWKMKAWTVPAMFPVPKVREAFDENGRATDGEATNKRAKIFVDELIWCINAAQKMKQEENA